MRDKILQTINNLISHEINKQEAQDILFGLCLVCQNPNVAGALQASVNAIYFSDSSDYRSAHYSVIKKLTGLENEEININQLFNQLNPEL